MSNVGYKKQGDGEDKLQEDPIINTELLFLSNALIINFYPFM